MTSRLNPYLNFRGTAREAIEFYASVFGGTPDIRTFASFGMPVGPGEEELVMHSGLETPAGYTIYASDLPAHMEYTRGTHQFSVSLSGDAASGDELRSYWERLSEGATIQEPLTAAPWGDEFGSLTDRFGVDWLINIGGQ